MSLTNYPSVTYTKNIVVGMLDDCESTTIALSLSKTSLLSNLQSSFLDSLTATPSNTRSDVEIGDSSFCGSYTYQAEKLNAGDTESLLGDVLILSGNSISLQSTNSNDNTKLSPNPITMVFKAFLADYPSVSPGTATFTVEIGCSLTSLTFDSAITTPISHEIYSPALTFDVSMTQVPSCASTVSYSISPSYSWMTISGTTLTINPTSPSDAIASTQFTLTGSVSAAQDQQTFFVELLNPCLSAILTAGSEVTDTQFFTGDPQSVINIDPQVSVSGCGAVAYSLSPVSANNPLVVLNSPNDRIRLRSDSRNHL